METATLSAKYQVVIPKSIRASLNLRPGQRLILTLNGLGDVIIQTSATPLEELSKQFGGRKLWGNDPAKTIELARNDWNR
jgi:AbrB family looped-hinge helix DNA binding protein